MTKAAEKRPRASARQSRPEQIRRVAARRETIRRKLRIVEQLTAGVSVARIALAENCTVRRVRQIIAETLAARAIDPPADYVKLQIARLSDAMMVAHVKMIDGDLQAIDRVVKLVGELDRYHGFGGALVAPPPEAPPSTPLRIAAAPRVAPAAQLAPAELEAEIFPSTSA
jgi:hypothetical protein